MADALLTVENLSKSFGEKLLFEDISFGINAGQKTALIARNGTGKTSLLNIITGSALADTGKVVFRNDVRMAYLPQNPLMNETMTVREYVFASENKYVQAVNNYEKALLNIQLSPSTLHEKQLQDAMNTMDTIGAWDYENRVKEILSRLEVNDLDKTIAMLSGGERKKIALSKVLIDDTNLLILDEPTNHLDIKMIEWLEEFLSKQNLSILMVTHDRYFLDNVCHDIIEIDKGHLFRYKGTYAYYVEKKAERQEIERREIEKAKNLYRTELDWMRRMPSARGTKARARIDAFYELKDKALQRIDDHRPTLSVKTERIGGKILEMYNVSKQYEGKNLVDDFTYTFKKNEKIGIVGQNGVGKSTFLNIITQALKPDSGNIVVGQTVQFGFYTQNGLTESDDRRVIEIIKDAKESPNYYPSYLFGTIWKSIGNGIILPKHGRLIDADAFIKRLQEDGWINNDPYDPMDIRELVEEGYSPAKGLSGTKYMQTFYDASTRAQAFKDRTNGEEDPTFDYNAQGKKYTLKQIIDQFGTADPQGFGGFGGGAGGKRTGR